jgi:Na+-driven multidrug efflux pump
MGVIVRMVAQFGTAAVAAVGAGTRVESFALMVILALGASLIPFIGQNWGAGKFDRVHLAQRCSNRFTFWWGLLCAVVFLLIAAPIARLFSEDPDVVDGIVSYLWIVPIGYGLQGISLLASASFNAVNKPLAAASLSLIRMFVLYIPLAYFGGRLLGLRGLFGGMSLANIVAGVIALLWLAHARKREPQRP